MREDAIRGIPRLIRFELRFPTFGHMLRARPISQRVSHTDTWLWIFDDSRSAIGPSLIRSFRRRGHGFKSTYEISPISI